MTKTVAIICARGGSKGIPHKNVKILKGKPLVVWSIEAALGSTYIDEVYVTTENERIAEIARQAGATIIKRPEYLATDHVQSREVVLDAYRQIDGEVDISEVVVLTPTSPLRTAEHIDEAFDLYYDAFAEASVISVVRDRRYHWRWETTANRDIGLPVEHNPLLRLGRQDQQYPFYVENGAIHICSAEKLSDYRDYFPPPYVLYVMPDYTAVELDEPHDWVIMERLMEVYGT